MERIMTDHQRLRYRRHLLLPDVGEEGQEKLLRSRVLLVGLGGLGSPVLLYLAAAGVGEIGIMDPDRVEWSNLQRQILYTEGDLGRGKATCAGNRVLEVRKDLRVNVHPERFSSKDAGELVKDYEFVIEATDNVESKFLVNDACVVSNTPFSHAGVVELRGQTMTVLPRRGPCVRCVFGDVPDPEAEGPAEERGILGPVAGVVGAIQAVEAIKYLVGFGDLLVGRLLTWDAARMRFHEVRLPAEPSCELCRAVMGAEAED
jgi:adenylyltransferase/sulfurtransferase